MKRRSFLSMLGIAPVAAMAPAIAKADILAVGPLTANNVDPSRILIQAGTIAADKIVAGRIIGAKISCPSVSVTLPFHEM